MSRYSNKLIYCFEKALLDTLGAHGVRALKGLASVYDFWSELPPLNDLGDIDADYIGNICQTSIAMYGPQGSCALQEAIGATMYAGVAEHFYPLNILSLTPGGTLFAALEPLLAPFHTPPTLFETGDTLVCKIVECPNCEPTSRHQYFADTYGMKGICDFVRGYLKAAIEKTAPGRHVVVIETACRIMGQEACVFEITGEPQ